MTNWHQERMTRRRALKAGLAGAAVMVWSKPAIASVPVIRGHHASPFEASRQSPEEQGDPGTTGSPEAGSPEGGSGSTGVSGIAVTSSVVSATPVEGDTYEIVGNSAVTNTGTHKATVTGVSVVIEQQQDGAWVAIPTTVSAVPCQGAKLGSCTGEFRVTATLPQGATLRAVVEVQASSNGGTVSGRSESPFNL